MALISLKEYAERHEIKHTAQLRHKIKLGTLNAQKIGSQWVIDEDEPYIDYRIKSGKYVGWRRGK